MGKKLPGKVLKYLVLEACSGGPNYGYGIVSWVEDLTDGYWTPSYGTIYPLMQRLEDDGLIRAIGTEEADQRNLEDGDRKYFEITDEGQQMLEEASREKRDGFEDLILGYIKVFEHVHGEKEARDLLDRF